jgi:hypothetical protein
MIAETQTSKMQQHKQASKKNDNMQIRNQWHAKSKHGPPNQQRCWSKKNFKNRRKCLVTSLLSNHSTQLSLLGKHLSLSKMHYKHLRKKFNVAGL